MLSSGCQGQQLYFKSRANSGAETVSAGLRQHPDHLSASIADTATQPTEVTAIAWDVASKSAAKSPSPTRSSARNFAAASSGARPLAQRVRRAPRQRSSLPPLIPSVHAESPFAPTLSASSSDTATTGADARIAVGTMIRLASLGPLFSGLYYVSEVNHTFDPQTGAITKFTVESPALGQTQ